MYSIIKDVIDSGMYKLSDILKKIDVIWLQGDITDEERDELIGLARDDADYMSEVSVQKKFEEYESRLRTLEEKVAKLEEGGDTEPVIPEEYPEYVVGEWYYNGDKITFGGEKYVCSAPIGQVCTWSPTEYPVYWQKVESI